MIGRYMNTIYQPNNQAMRKISLFGIVLMGSWAFQGCSGDEERFEGRGDEAPQVISLAVSSGGTQSTRAGRPLLSSAADHTIEHVAVYVVKASDNTVVATKQFDDWQHESADYRTDDGRYVEFLLDEKLEDGNYRIFAVGYHDGSAYGDIPSELVSGSIFQENAILTLGSDQGAEELFAGSTESFAVKKSRGFKQEIVLNRQVAGVYVYAKEIPCLADATQLKLVSSDENNRLVLGQFANLDLTDNGTGSGITVAVVNGASAAPEFDKTLAAIDLTEWFTTLSDSDGDNLIDTGSDYSNWHKPSRYAGVATFEKGSVFGGAFVIPFAKVDMAQTLKLQLTTSSGEVKREWDVNLPTTDPYTLYTWNGTDFGSGTSVTEDSHSYNIVRNHLYGLGTRGSNDPGDGTDPAPTPGDDDDPISLNNKHELKLIVNDNWEVIHDMELD